MFETFGRAIVILSVVSRCMAAGHSRSHNGLEWFPCPTYTNLSCAYFEVPLDYHNASAGNGQLLIIKANATGPEKKGTIFLNPGGPGVSGLSSLATDSEALMNRSGGAFDFVSWDPRGVGPYTYPGNVYCIDDEEYTSFWNGTIEANGINYIGNFTNQTDLDVLYAQVPVMDAKYKEFGEKCLQGPNGTNLQYIGSAATVRDLVGMADAIVGPDSPIFYWGLSYGTIIGAWFMNMFPERVGRVILDGVLDATRVATTQSYLLWRDQVSSTEDVYTAFANGCAMSGPGSCPLASFEGASGQDVVDYISTAFEIAHDHLDGATLRSLRAYLYGSLYQPQLWSQYTNETLYPAYSQIHNQTAITKRDLLTKRATYTQNSYTEPAVVCADSVDSDTSLTMTQILDEIVDVARTVSHSFGGLWPIPWFRCSYWPVRAVERYQGPFNGTYPHKILVIGNSHDGATPFFEAQRMAEVLGDQAALVQQDGFGHTSIYQSSQCTTDIITAYLEDGTVPTGNSSVPTVCPIDDWVEVFPGVKSVDIVVNSTVTDRE